MQSLLERIWRDQGFTAVLVTHDVAEAVTLADRVLMLDCGRIAPRLRRFARPTAARLRRSAHGVDAPVLGLSDLGFPHRLHSPCRNTDPFITAFQFGVAFPDLIRLFSTQSIDIMYESCQEESRWKPDRRTKPGCPIHGRPP